MITIPTDCNKNVFFRTKSFGHQIDSRRTPLVILSLSISPETTTMVPSVIRRDPLRLPPYCMRQQQPRTNSATSTAKDSDITDDRQQPLTSDANHISIAEHSGSQRSGSSSPEFYIRGVVIGGKLKAEPSIDDPYHQPIDSRQHKPRHQQRFCDAIWRRRSREGEASDDDGDINDNDDDGDDDDENAQRIEDCSRIDELLRMDGYEMDRFGHLPGNSRTPTPMQRRRGWTPDIDAIYPEGKSPRRPLRTNTAPPRIPSPTTGQIIRIVFNK